MSVIKKKLDLDAELLERVQAIYGESSSLTYIVTELLWALVREHEASNVTLPKFFQKAARDAKEAISISTEI